MSDNILKIAPRDPLSRPSEEAEMAVNQFLKKMIPHHDTLEAKRHGSVVFVDCGENHERTTCPRRGADLGQHWHQWMNESYRRSGLVQRKRSAARSCAGRKTWKTVKAARSAAGSYSAIISYNNGS